MLVHEILCRITSTSLYYTVAAYSWRCAGVILYFLIKYTIDDDTIVTFLHDRKNPRSNRFHSPLLVFYRIRSIVRVIEIKVDELKKTNGFYRFSINTNCRPDDRMTTERQSNGRVMCIELYTRHRTTHDSFLSLNHGAFNRRHTHYYYIVTTLNCIKYIFEKR